MCCFSWSFLFFLKDGRLMRICYDDGKDLLLFAVIIVINIVMRYVLFSWEVLSFPAESEDISLALSHKALSCLCTSRSCFGPMNCWDDKVILTSSDDYLLLLSIIPQSEYSWMRIVHFCWLFVAIDCSWLWYDPNGS